MPYINPDEVKNSYFVFGCVKDPTPPYLTEKIDSTKLKISPIGEYGYYFHNLPGYAQEFDTEEMVWIKFGHFHDGKTLLSMGEIIANGWVNPSGIQVDRIEGDGVLLGFSKHHPVFYIYRNLLSASAIYYSMTEDNFIAADNLGILSDFLPAPELNDDAIVQHFIYRQLNGRETYFKQIDTLLVGELINFGASGMKVGLVKPLQAITQHESEQKPVTEETVEWFFNEFKQIVGLYLDGNLAASASMLSGGIDSSLVQAAINTQVNGETRFPSLSFVIDSPGFAYEVDYAKEASQALNTNHTFVQLTPQSYAEGLINCTQILGEPLPDDVRFCFYLLADYIKSNNQNLKYLFHGGHADGLHGGSRGLRAVQGDKYSSWPAGLLSLAGTFLTPISQSKSYGAKTAANVLKSAKDISSPENYLNSSSVYTNWELVNKYFSQDLVQSAFDKKRNLEVYYLNSPYMVEKVSTLGLVTTGIRQRSLERTMGHFCGLEYIYPFGDEAIVKASYAFKPLDRYVQNHQVKPILKKVLVAQTKDIETKKPKGWSGYGMSELFASMRKGELSDMVQAIERPGFMEHSDFKQSVNQPDWFTWNMLTLDLFKKYVLNSK
jgi:asparagine synthetase B (glutamine-hydrolysing)